MDTDTVALAPGTDTVLAGMDTVAMADMVTEDTDITAAMLMDTMTVIQTACTVPTIPDTPMATTTAMTATAITTDTVVQ